MRQRSLSPAPRKDDGLDPSENLLEPGNSHKSSTAPGLASQAQLVMTGLAHGSACALGAVYWMWVFHDKMCGEVMRCGCTWPWDGGWKRCNIHNSEGPRCPWCVAAGASTVLGVLSQKSCPLGMMLFYLWRSNGTMPQQMGGYGRVASDLVTSQLASAASSLMTDTSHFVAMGLGAGATFAFHLRNAGSMRAGAALAAVPPLFAVCLARKRPATDDRGGGGGGGNLLRRWAVSVAGAVAIYFAIEFAWLLVFFSAFPEYPHFLFYTRASAEGQ